MRDQTPILLQTKLNRPRLPHDLVIRQRLVELLNNDIDRQLILVCAPAGFGKTTLVSTWLEQMDAHQTRTQSTLPAAWLSLDDSDSDLNIFLRYFTAAIRTIFDDTCTKTLALLQARQQPPAEVLYATLSNELEKLPGECILVLDDYHIIHNMEVHNLIGELARHWPKPLHLVLISRLSPPIGLSRLRARGMLSEIRTRDLRFTPGETAAYLSQVQFAIPGQNALPLLEERFEGWPAGLHLASLSLRAADSPESVLAALSSENTNITAYLVDEVLTHQTPAIQAFLLKTSILDHFCAELCEAVVGESDPAWNAHACLNWIERSELFITPLDDRREWYRYHPLFQELLKQKLSAELAPDEVTELHRLASAWLAEHGFPDEALQHALAAGDLALAARQMGAGLRDALNREDRPNLERWLHMLPEEMIQQRPDLLMIRVWILEYTWRLQLQARALQQIEELLASGGDASIPPDDLQNLRGQIFAIRAQHAYFNNQATRAIDLCRQVLRLLPPSWTFVRGGAMLFLGLAMQANDQSQDAERIMLDEYEAYTDKTDAYALLVLRSLIFIYLNSGQLEQAYRVAQVLLQGSTNTRIAIMKNWADWFLGLVCYQRNDLNAAAQYFMQIVENRYTAQITVYRDAVAGLALIHQSRGKSHEAWQMVESISQFDVEQKGSEDERTRSLRARLQLLQDNPEDARKWADSFTGPPPDLPLIWLEEPQITRARILAKGAETNPETAMQVLDALDEIAERTHNTRYRIEILALRSLALDAQGETSQADAVLVQALDLARPGCFIRVFVDLGERMQSMLCRLEQQGHGVEIARRILAAYSKPEEMIDRRDGYGQSKSSAPPDPASPVEPLTPREIEVLTYLRGPLSIKEIALKLYISYATAKRHTINLYAKLGANQRWDAVARAEELKILPPR